MNKNIKSVAALAIAVILSVLINSFIAAPKKAHAEPFSISPGNCFTNSGSIQSGDDFGSVTNDNGTQQMSGSNFYKIYGPAGAWIAFFDSNLNPSATSLNTLNCGSRQAMTAVQLVPTTTPLPGPTGDGVSYNIQCCNLVGT
jgi:hypothetical protein